MINTFFGANLVDYHTIRIAIFSEVNKSDSSPFNLIIDSEKIIVLEIAKQSYLNGLCLYECRSKDKIELGHNYVIQCRDFGSTSLNVNEATTFPTFDDDFYYDGDDLGALYSKEKTTFKKDRQALFAALSGRQAAACPHAFPSFPFRNSQSFPPQIHSRDGAERHCTPCGSGTEIPPRRCFSALPARGAQRRNRRGTPFPARCRRRKNSRRKGALRLQVLPAAGAQSSPTRPSSASTPKKSCTASSRTAIYMYILRMRRSNLSPASRPSPAGWCPSFQTAPCPPPNISPWIKKNASIRWAT